ncbi:MAG: hypothetical protein NT077_01305 [Candidatus Taylorbacteria bacterium]|nr:hypothetical protein [Candidatus Taylorbacteria bacterium]
MKIRELFKPTCISQSVGGLAVFLDKDNCQIVNKTKSEKSIILHLKRESDEEEGRAHLRVQDQFETISDQLLNWAFAYDGIIGLTLNQLEDLETNLNVENIKGRLQVEKN